MKKSKSSTEVSVAPAPPVASSTEPETQESVLEETGPERYARVQRELAEAETQERKRRESLPLVPTNDRTVVPPPPAPGKVIRGSGMTYREAIAAGLTTTWPCGLSPDSPWQPPAPTKVIAGVPEVTPQAEETTVTVSSAPRGACPRCGMHINLTIACHKLPDEVNSKSEVTTFNAHGLPVRYCILDRARAQATGLFSPEQLAR